MLKQTGAGLTGRRTGRQESRRQGSASLGGMESSFVLLIFCSLFGGKISKSQMSRKTT